MAMVNRSKNRVDGNANATVGVGLRKGQVITDISDKKTFLFDAQHFYWSS